MAAERHGIAADVDERVRDPGGAKQPGRAVECVAFGVTAKIEPHRAICARHRVAPNGQIAHAGMSPDQAPDVLRFRHGSSGFVAMKAPSAHESPYRWIEEIARLRGEALRLADERSDLRRRANVLFAASNRLIESDQVALLPRVQRAMHPVELSEDLPDCSSRSRGVGIHDRASALSNVPDAVRSTSWCASDPIACTGAPGSAPFSNRSMSAPSFP